MRIEIDIPEPFRLTALTHMSPWWFTRGEGWHASVSVEAEVVHPTFGPGFKVGITTSGRANGAQAAVDRAGAKAVEKLRTAQEDFDRHMDLVSKLASRPQPPRAPVSELTLEDLDLDI